MSVINDVKTLLKKDPSVAQKPTAETQPQKKVLIVEDEILLLDMYTEEFEHSGYKVLRAKNGKQGLTIVKKHKPDLILLDLMMPVMDGTTMLHHLRKIPGCKDTPVIVLTNAGNIDNMRATQMYYGANAFLIKANTTPGEIIQTAKRML